MKTLQTVIALAVSASALTACNSDNAAVVDTTPKNVSIEFVAKVGNEIAKCGTTLPAMGTPSVTSTLNDLRFYVTGVHLIGANDKEYPITLDKNDWQSPADNVALLDFEDATGDCATAGTAATNMVVKGTAPAGTYTGIGFTVGVPAKSNHTDYSSAKAPLDVQAMAWTWQSGRKFAKIELNPTGGVSKTSTVATTGMVMPSTSFNLHLASTGCTGTSLDTYACSVPNAMAFHSHAFNLNTQRVVVDLATLFATSNLAVDAGGPTGCMSSKTDPECKAIFESLKIAQDTGLPINDGHGQQLFRVENKPSTTPAVAVIEVLN